MAETNSCDLLWLVGQRLQSVSVTAESWWSFHFDEHCSISTYGPWRLIEEGRIRVTSEDHGHPFGLPAPVDAVERVATSVGDRKICRITVESTTGDLSLDFGNAVVLQFLQLSCGHEAWQCNHHMQSVICQGGGNLAVWDRDAR